MFHANYCAQFIPSEGMVLDVGAGSGHLACEMARRGFRVWGIEINPAYIFQASTHAKTLNVVVDFKQGSAEHLPFAGDQFDFVNCAEVTEHVENPTLVCQEIYRVLKLHGYAYISFHNRWSIFDYHYHLWFINWLPRSWAEALLNRLGKNKSDGVAGRQKLVSMHYYTYNQICRMLQKIGFAVRDVRVEKIRSHHRFLAPFFLLVYKIIFRPFYFNTFHILLQK